MSNQLSQFFESTIHCDSVANLEALCVKAFREFGVTHFICANIMGLKCAPDRAPLFGTYESDWMKHYIRNGYYVDDPLMQNYNGLNGNGLPYFWSDLQMNTVLSPFHNKIFKEAWEAGLQEGLLVPLQTGANEYAVFSYAGLNLKPNLTTKGTLHAMAVQAHARARQILLLDNASKLMRNRVHHSAKPNVSALTNAEINVLKLLAADLGAGAIAKTRNVSISTVRKHIASAKDKMQVDELTGLIATAYRQKIIT